MNQEQIFKNIELIMNKTIKYTLLPKGFSLILYEIIFLQ